MEKMVECMAPPKVCNPQTTPAIEIPSSPCRLTPRALSDATTFLLSSLRIKPLSTWMAITLSGPSAALRRVVHTALSTPPLTKDCKRRKNENWGGGCPDLQVVSNAPAHFRTGLSSELALCSLPPCLAG